MNGPDGSAGPTAEAIASTNGLHELDTTLYLEWLCQYILSPQTAKIGISQVANVQVPDLVTAKIKTTNISETQIWVCFTKMSTNAEGRSERCGQVQ